MGEQPRADLAAGNDPFGQLGDAWFTVLGWACVDRPDDLAAEELSGLVIDLLGHFVADLDQRGAIGSDLRLGGDVDHDRFQDRQLFHPSRPTLRGNSRRTGRSLGGRHWRRFPAGQIGFDGSPSHLELVFVELLGGAPEVALEGRLQLGLGRVALQFGQLQPIAGRRMGLAFGQVQRLVIDRLVGRRR
ncbi:MAG TPA: hypothetical protein VGL42_04220, partial [Opitutaceae bacterium]